MFTCISPSSPGWRMKTYLSFLFVVFISGSPVANTESVMCNDHGFIQEDERCICQNCWSGENCEEYANPRPHFLRKDGQAKLVEHVTIGPDTDLKMPLYIVKATISPGLSELCPSEGPCPCSEQLHYSFGAGNDMAYFSIDSKTGNVKINEDYLPTGFNGYLPISGSYDLQVIASNLDNNQQDEMWLHVGASTPVLEEGSHNHFIDPMGEAYMSSDHHHVHQRAAVTLPDNVTFTLTKTGNSQNLTEMRVGTKVSFQLQILFPLATTDMLVELFAPDNDSIVMMLCDVQVSSKGSNLQIATDMGTIKMDSQNSSNKYYDRAIIDFGNVTNTFADTSALDSSSIYIIWDAVMIQNENTVDQNVYWVSAGAEYNNEMEVWVGQASFTARTNAETDSFGTPTFNLSGPSTMEIGSSAVFTLDIYITKPSVFLSVDAFAPYNNTDVMSICGMEVVSTAVNYQCGFISEEHTATFHADSNTRGNGRARLELGTVTNKGARESGNPTANNRITVQFVVHLYDDSSYVGQSYWVGAAVEIGSDQIWAGEIKVTAGAISTSSISPTWTLTKADNGKVSATSPLLMTLDISIPQNTAGKYALEALAPFNDSAAVYQLCALRIVAVGKNLLCTDTEISPMYTSRGNPMYVDRAYVDLGSVSNVGPWGWQPLTLNPNTTDPNTLRVEFLIKATDHTLATPGTEHKVTLGLFINDNRLLIGSYAVEVDTASTVPNITDQMTPEWNLTWLSGDGNIPIGGSGQFLVNVVTKRNVVYAPFDVEALMPNSTGSTQVSICKVQVHSIGANLPCVVASALNASVTYTSLQNDGINDRGVLKLPSVCNYEVKTDTAEDELVLRVSFMLQPDAGLTNQQELWPSVGIMFSPYKIWVGQIKAWARNDISNSANAPHVSVLKISGDVPIGYIASYRILIKTVPGDSWPYALNVSVSNPGLSVCSVKVLEVGVNMPCFDGTTTEAAYETDSTGMNIKGSLDMGTISNAASGSVTADDNVDDNTIVVEVTIGLTSDVAVISDGSSLDFSVQVDYGTSVVTPTVPPFNVIHDQSSINDTATGVTKVELTVAPVSETDNSTDVVLGQSKRLQLCVWTLPGVVTKLSTKMLTPVGTPGLLEAVYIGTSVKGKNMPCPGNCKSGTITYQSRTGSSFLDIASVDFGYLANNNFDTTDVDANKICVDGVFRVLKNEASLTVASTVKASASVNVNDVEISVIEMTFTVADNSTFVDTYPENMTLTNSIVAVNSTLPDPLCLTPGDVQTFPLLFNVPAYITSVVNMDIKLQVDQSACMTYKDVRLMGVGRNLAGFGKDYDLQCTANYSMGTTQADSVECSFGVVTNPGMSHRCGDVQPEDDTIYLEVDVQVADCLAAEKDENITASFGFKVASYIAILNFPVKVCRDGSEAPIYNITAGANSTGNAMFVSYDIRLDNTSKAEIHNSSVVLMPPPYITCASLASNTGTNMAPVLDTTIDKRLIIDIGSIYFTDIVSLVVRCDSKNGYTVPNGVNGLFTVMPFHVSGDVIARQDSSLSSQRVWSDLDFVNFTATTVSDTGVSCVSNAVGLQDSNVIFDCQITGSSPSLSAVKNVRKGGTGWIPYVREGELASERYIQVYFPNKMLVDRVEVTQTGASKATEIKLAYSNDGRSFLDGDTITLINPSGIVTVPSPQDTQVLRVYITKDDLPGKQVSLTLEFYGCATSSGGPSGSSAVCTAANAAVPAQSFDALFYHRSFLALSSGTVFVCDGVVKSKGTEQRCYMSADGAVWQPLDNRVASMVGHEPETDRVYALSSDGVTYMSSGDQGKTWESSHSDTVAAAKTQPLYAAAKDVPWTDNVQLPTGDPQVSYRMDVWGASYDSLQKNPGSWGSKLKWNCC